MTELEYERLQYGTNTQPGELLCDSAGNYFVFESDQNGILVNWSTNQSADEALQLLYKTFVAAKFGTQPNASVIGLEASDVVNDRMNDDVEVLSLPSEEAALLISTQLAQIAFTRIAFETLDFTWQSPYARFDDSLINVLDMCGRKEVPDDRDPSWQQLETQLEEIS